MSSPVEANAITLTPPEVLAPVAPKSANDLVPTKPEELSGLEVQVDRFVQGLVGADLGSDDFKAKLDAAHAIGRQSMTASSIVAQRFMDKNFIGLENSPAFKAINGLRNVFEDLNPAREGDLLSVNKLLGFI